MGSRAKESELDKCVDRAYRQLKEKIYKTKYSGGVFECPFCVERKGEEYMYDELVQHAKRRGKGAKDMNLKHQGQHLALAEYLVKHHTPKAPPPPSNKGAIRGQSGRDMVSRHSSRKEMKVGTDSPKVPLAPVDKGEVHAQCGGGDAQLRDSREEEMRVGAENSSSTYFKQDKCKKFVVPWKCVLENVPIVFKDGRYVGESGNKMKAQLAEQGIYAEGVTPLWSKGGHSGCCVVDFANNWIGFGNAMKLEKAFEVDRRGKTDWNMARSRGAVGDKIYGWVAMEEDYHSRGLLGNHLRPKSDLKSIQDIKAEEERKAEKLVQNLTSNIENKNLECKMMTDKLEAMSDSARNVMDESDAMVEAHNKEMNKMHRKQREEMESVLAEHERTKKKIESQKKQLKLQEKELEKREVRNENELRELSHQQRTNEIANEVQLQVHANMLKLAEEQKNEKEALHKKIIVLEKELDHKQALELEVERMRGAMNVMKHMGDDEDVYDKKKMESIKELEDKIEELEDMEALKQALIIKEHKASEEMQEALDAIIAGLQGGSTKGAKPTIGVKTVGEIDRKPFEVAAKKKFSADVASVRAAEWLSLYEAYVRDISWHPFKHVSEEGTDKEVIDEEDGRLQKLKNELGEEPYNAVVTALTELNEYSPEDRTPRAELWNFKNQEKSDLNEGAIFLLNKWKLARKRR